MYRLTSSLPYLLNRVGARFGWVFAAHIAPRGITLPMYRVLAALREVPDQRLGELSAMTSIDLSTMSRLIGAMARRKLVSRVRVPDDERTVRINVTRKGAALGTKLMLKMERHEERAVAALKAADLAQIKRGLRDIDAALESFAQARGRRGRSARS